MLFFSVNGHAFTLKKNVSDDQQSIIEVVGSNAAKVTGSVSIYVVVNATSRKVLLYTR